LVNARESGGLYEGLVADIERRIRNSTTAVTDHLGRLSIWLRYVKEEYYRGSPVELTQGSTTRIILEAETTEEFYRILAENIVLKVFGEELRLTRGVPEIVLKLFDDKYHLPPKGKYADHTTELKLKVTVYRHRPGLFDRLFIRRSRGAPR